MVLADGGVLCIDEFDKMDKKNYESILEPMEQQTVTISKAGIHSSLNARCSVFAVANPFTISAPLASRFDIILRIYDKPHQKYDRLAATHIINNHSNFKSNDEDDINDDDDEYDLILNYIDIVKQNFNPLLNEEVRKEIVNYYVLERNIRPHLTVRYLESIIRLCEANAKLRCSNEVESIDFKEVKEIINSKYIFKDTTHLNNKQLLF
ncbi:hypothetical protein DICPUDRAFT_92333 [Dictyostelium purpureum]|uniref:DNA helicase n=1 Tax=Dictyostelium purpureum TaxID=5786 RepID=F0ZQB0_DICPU|nr:uncharacterized protein DICPUDRAFT_92333 [Dictyostelium purpureum]EGC33872.1 hypothetical protein DICPUDRAFT_92333 [Dictyostelium purpureum]|eukprot:XP_003289610.1 hypothetical protein DICPUDRAFT_92333 [Dictyostelium purpureum]